MGKNATSRRNLALIGLYAGLCAGPGAVAGCRGRYLLGANDGGGIRSDGAGATVDGGGDGSPPGTDGSGDLAPAPFVPPPFAVPDGPAAGTLRLCGLTVQPAPVGFAPDGVPLIAQRYDDDSLWVRRWDPRTNRVDPLPSFSGQGFYYIAATGDGDHLVGLTATGNQFDVHDLVNNRSLSSGTAVVAASRFWSVSADGQYVLDDRLVRHAASGAGTFMFSPVMAAQFPGLVATGAALSPTGDAIAVSLIPAPPHAAGDLPLVMARLFDDGRSEILDSRRAGAAEAITPMVLRWSSDGRRLLAHSVQGGPLRLWEFSSTAAPVDLGREVNEAGFLPEGRSLIAMVLATAEVLELSFEGGVLRSWGRGESVSRAPSEPRLAITGIAARAEGQRLISGWPVGEALPGLYLHGPGGILGRWPDDKGGWRGHSAITTDTLFTVENVALFRVAVAKRAATGGPVQAQFSTEESQSEWEGTIARSPDGRRLAVAFPDSVRVLSADALALLATLPLVAGEMAWSPDGRYLAITPTIHYRDTGKPRPIVDKRLALWDSSVGGAPRFIDTPVVPMTAAFDDRGARLVGWGYGSVTVTGEHPTSVWMLSPVGTGSSYEVDLATGLGSASALPVFEVMTRELGATRSDIYTLSAGARVSHLARPIQASGHVRRAAISDDWSTLAAYTDAPQPELALFAVKDGRLLASRPVPFMSALSISADGRRVVEAREGEESVYCFDPGPSTGAR